MKPHQLKTMGPIALLFWLLLLPAITLAGITASEVFVDLGFNEADQKRALQGELVTTERSESSDRELTVVMAFIVEVPPDEILEEFYRAADFKVDSNVRVQGWINGAGTLADFNGVKLQPGGAKAAKRYIEADPDDYNFSREEAVALSALAKDKSTEAVEKQLREILLSRLQSYQQAGLSGIPPYNRGNKNYKPSNDMRQAIESQALFAKYAPQLKRTLLEYPNYKAEGLREKYM